MLISFVMAAYNAAPYLNDTIAGIIEQTYTNWECIIINDGSTDDTGNILDSIDDNRFKVIHLTKNKGAAYALNIGLSRASGQWIAIHDADDISLPERIEEQVKYLAKKPDLIAVGSFIECIPGGTAPINKKNLRQFAAGRNKIRSYEDIKEILFYVSFLTHGTMLISKNALLAAGGYNQNLKIAYDYYLWTKMVHLGPMENVPRVLYRYRVYQESLSQKNSTLTSREVFFIASRYILKTRGQDFSNRKPNIIVIGPRKGCQYFKNAVRDIFYVSRAVSEDYINSLPRVLSMYKKGAIDFIILLANTPGIEIITSCFKENKLKLNKEYFIIWTAIM